MIKCQPPKFWYSNQAMNSPPWITSKICSIWGESHCYALLIMSLLNTLFLCLQWHSSVDFHSIFWGQKPFQTFHICILLSVCLYLGIHSSFLGTVLSFLCFSPLSNFIYVTIYRSMTSKYISCPNLSTEFWAQIDRSLSWLYFYLDASKASHSTHLTQNSDPNFSSSTVCYL